MPRRKQDKLAEIRAWMDSRGISRIGCSEFAELGGVLGAGEPELRRLLREVEVDLSPWAEGVRQDDFEHLRRTLEALTVEYEDAQRAGDQGYAREIRRLVITAKDHARFASRSARDEARRREKEEMVEWMLVWLENPAIFTQWARLRVRAAKP